MNQTEFFGHGCINNLEYILKKENSKRIFLVRGKNSYKLSGAEQIIDPILSSYDSQEFYNFSSNPKIEEIEEGFSLFMEKDYDALIAVGGGSAIDVAKAIKLFSSQKHSNKKVSLIAIPTTAGSGSEATHFIVYYEGKKKQSKGDENLTLPNYAICDPKLTLSLPRYVAAATGMDALGQAIESYWSVNSTEESKRFSERAINILMKNLDSSTNKNDLSSREKVMKAANLAGKAINIAKTTACHSISYPITSFFGIPHGHAVGLTLGEMLIYNSKVSDNDCIDKRGTSYVKRTINEIVEMLDTTPVEAKDKLQCLMENIGLETRLSKLNIGKDEIDVIIENAFTPERMKNNPRLIDKENLRVILNNILK
mgnify:CR=1 FL=1